jgi:hypothetical protein
MGEDAPGELREGDAALVRVRVVASRDNELLVQYQPCKGAHRAFVIHNFWAERADVGRELPVDWAAIARPVPE